MRKYSLRQEFGIAEESGKRLKGVDIQLYVAEEGMKREQLLGLFNTFACGFVRLLGEETGAYESMGEWPQFNSNDGFDTLEKGGAFDE